MNRLLLALAVALAAGCSAKIQKPEARSQDPAYAFPHSPHIDGDVPCVACHASINGASRLEANLRHVAMPSQPSKDPACSGCHDTDPDVAVPARAEPFRFRFDHAAHLKTVKDCKTCHVDLKGYLPRTAFAHQGDWLRIHGAQARPTAESCAQCHDQTHCAECHAAQTTAARPSVVFPEDVARSFIHRGDYVSRHTVEARANPASCRSCHGSAFCEACHTQQGLTSAAANIRDPHPGGWSTDKGTSHFHGDAARRDILSCAGCHDNGASSTCVGCHQVGGIGGNPHPATFLRKHDGGDRSHNDMCRACHHGA